MPDVIAFTIAALLLVQALLRAPSAMKGRTRTRSLWGAFAALSASWLTRTTPGRDFLNDLGVPDLAYLVKHVLAIIGICVLLRYVTAVYSTTTPSADVPRTVRISSLVHRIATRASLATVLIMALVFFFMLDDVVVDSPHFVVRHASDPGLAIYMGLFYAYTAAAATVCAAQWGGAVKQIPRRAVKFGMGMMAVAMMLAVVYALLRIAYIVLITVRPLSEDFSLAQEAVTDAVLYATFLLWGFGAVAPAWQAARERYRTMTHLVAIHPLWREMAMTAPHRIRQRPRAFLARLAGMGQVNKLRDLLSYYDETPAARLQRFVTEIRDVMLELSRHAPPELAEHSLEHARNSTSDGDAQIKGEALWIRAAQAAYATLPEGPSAPLPFAAGTNLATEVPHFRAVAQAYRRITEREGWQILNGLSSTSAPASS
ncbi:MAB_1171c family putative transporter [Streptomyces sp. NPDC002476]|uniref:MAB_1171c family putative transporter n=1 Tax=Streptomyces sp. NPDC002476 TaxID=3364648 RepID=UPI0036CD2730